SFVHILEAGKNYVGGQIFFGKQNPADIPYISLIDEDENIHLLEAGSQIPEGLEDAICFYVVASTAAGLKDGWKEYKMLCHPSVKMADHDSVKSLIGAYISDIIGALRRPNDANSKRILDKLGGA